MSAWLDWWVMGLWQVVLGLAACALAFRFALVIALYAHRVWLSFRSEWDHVRDRDTETP